MYKKSTMKRTTISLLSCTPPFFRPIYARKLLNQVKTKAGKDEKFFDFGFDYADPEDIFITRGLLQQTSSSFIAQSNFKIKEKA